MKYYLYNQNNTGGSFDVDENVAEYVIIEAIDEHDAYEIAINIGIYFEGVDKELDCECCGDRWYYPSEYNTLEEAKERCTLSWFGKNKDCRIHLKNKIGADVEYAEGDESGLDTDEIHFDKDLFKIG